MDLNPPPYFSPQNLPIYNDSFAYHYWHKPPAHVNFSIYVFDVTNPDDVIKGAAPKLQEKGPYVWS